MFIDPVGGGAAAALRASLMIATVPGEMDVAAGSAVKGPPAQGRGAAMGDGPDGTTLMSRQRGLGSQEVGQEAAQHLDDRGTHVETSARQMATQLIHESQSVRRGLMGEVQIDHGGVDLLVAEQALDGVKMSAGFEQMSGEGMTQGMD